MERRQRGIIKIWKDEKGFGFIEPVEGGADLFFHANDVRNSRRRDLMGQRVTYVLVPGRDGKSAAGDVRLAVAEPEQELIIPVVREPRRYVRRRPRGPVGELVAWAVCIIFLATVTALSIRHASLYIPAAYVVLCAITYTTYSRDKEYAEAGGWRVSESTLHLMELVGGWPGALVAQWRIGHKNRKVSYQVKFWLVVAVHVTVVGFVAYHRYSNRDNPRAIWNVDRSTESREPMTGNVRVEWSDSR